jgi:hypothetical protein
MTSQNECQERKTILEQTCSIIGLFENNSLAEWRSKGVTMDMAFTWESYDESKYLPYPQ